LQIAQKYLSSRGAFGHKHLSLVAQLGLATMASSVSIGPKEFSNVAWLATKNLTWTERVHSCSKTGSEVVISWGPLCSLINGHLEVPNATSGCDNCKMCWPVRLGIYSSAINT
jgi:hypothetical protein